MTILFDKYKRYGSYHWDWYENKPKYKIHVDKVVSWIKEKSVLDVGAGDGLITFKLKAKGIDNNGTGVALAKEKGADVILSDVYKLPFKDEEFESVFMGDTLEHLEFPFDALKEVRRVLSKNLYITGPYRRGLDNFDYETANWTIEEITKNVSAVGFTLDSEIEIVGRHAKRCSFYAKFRKNMNTTIIYVSSNREYWTFEKRIIKHLLKNCGDVPIISVTQKPINLGKNICVGDVGASGFNMFRQVLIGLKEATTKFVISAEADCLYPPDYFQFVPEQDDAFYRNQNCYLMGNKRDYFYKKSVGSTFSQVVGREHYIKRLEKLFKGAPEWSVDEKNFPKERWRKEDVVDTQVFFNLPNPCISFKSGKGMRHFSTTKEREPIYDIAYWGNSKKLRKKFLTNIS